MRIPSFAELLKRVRVSSGLSQFDLANELKVEQSTVQRWESGVSEPRGPRKERIQAFFASKGVTMTVSFPEDQAPAESEIDPMLTSDIVTGLMKAGLDPEQIDLKVLNFFVIRNAKMAQEISRLSEQLKSVSAELRDLIKVVALQPRHRPLPVLPRECQDLREDMEKSSDTSPE